MSGPSLPSRQRPSQQQREQLDLFRALPGEDMAPRDAQDLMAYPFFSLAKSRRTAPIDFRSGNVTLRVEGTQEHGIATIRSEEHTSELQSRGQLVCRLLLEKKKRCTRTTDRQSHTTAL